MSSSEMVGELKCEFDVSSQCVTGEWSFTFTHDVFKYLYIGDAKRGREAEGEGERTAIITHTFCYNKNK